MGLTSYRRKRDFERSPEPRGRARPSDHERLYVIQKHAASRLHYDLRLEQGGVLKSWAVPKGPSLDPKDKRLAVEVEDHPVEYGSFEGVIPKGEYGAGTVLLWDRGRWIPEGDPAEDLKKGRLKFRLEGEKLRGGWTMVRLRDRGTGSKQPNWLLIKENDETASPQAKRDVLQRQPESVASKRTIEEIAQAAHRVWRRGHGEEQQDKWRPKPSRIERAKKSALATAVQFQLATLTDEPPIGDEWLHEIKLDGYRLQCRIHKGTVRLFTRTGQDWTGRFPGIASAAAQLPVEVALLDGEIVALAPDGRSSFQLLQQTLSEGNPTALLYYVFDLLYLDGFDLSSVPLEVRKDTLKQLLGLVPRAPTIRYSDHVVGDGAAFYREACRLGLEGMISKRRLAPFRPGRGHDWIKVKCLQRQEFVVGGFTEPSGSRSGLGALLLGVYEDGHLVYAGRVGTGFSTRVLKQLRARLNGLRVDRSPFRTPVPGGSHGVTWVRPELVGEVGFSEWTADGLLRHPSFQGIREEKNPRDVRRERPKPALDATKSGQTLSSQPKPTRRHSSSQPITDVRVANSGSAGLSLTHPERVLYPDQGLTKRDLATYYESIADWILPHIAGRPLMVVRCPEGYQGKCFYQKHANEAVPAAVKAVEIQEKAKEPARYLMVDDLAGLIALVQMDVLELHVWGARVDRIETPDRMVFDLDPDERLPWRTVVAAAKLVRDRLATLGLASWVKTTGGKGLHVVVPLTGPNTWEEVKSFSQAVAQSLAKDAPDRYTSKMSKAGRAGKIFIDYLRNGRGATAVAAYSTRARSSATVSVPVSWEELSRTTSDRFTVKNVPRRLTGLKHDPWRGFWNVRQSITQSARRSLRLI